MITVAQPRVYVRGTLHLRTAIAQVSAILASSISCGGSGGEAVTSPPPPVEVVWTVVVAPPSASLAIGETLRLTATARTVSGSALSGKSTTWQSSGPGVASVDSDGLVSAVGAGTAQITATVDGKSGSMSITVQSLAKVHSIQIDYPAATLALGQELRLQPTLFDSAGQRLTKIGLTWVADDTNIVRIDATGNVTATGAGQTLVRVAVDGVTQSSAITVIAFASIKAGPNVTCALTPTGQAYCAGTTFGSLASQVGGELRFATIESDGLPIGGPWHICGLTLDRKAYCWGDNRMGQLGIGNAVSRSTPMPVAGNQDFVQLSVGRAHACGLTTAGDAYCWGGNATDVPWQSNERGALGVGDTVSRFMPTAVIGGHKFKKIEAGWGTTCALTMTGEGYCWGRNELGQLGNGTNFGGLDHYESSPQRVAGGLFFKQIVTKGPRSCGLALNGRAYCWGNNTVHELGTRDAPDVCFGQKPCGGAPVLVATTETFLSLSTSQFATCGVTADGATFCWGLNNQYLFGRNDLSVCSAGPVFGCPPEPVAGHTNMVSISSSVQHACGIRRDGIAYCWGGNAVGQRGSPGTTADPTPRPFSIAPRSH
jgi:alpha-tubulin suppressor-like RCC1 family protein